MKKYHSWLKISRKLYGILYQYVDEEHRQEIVDKLFASLNKAKDNGRRTLNESTCQKCNDINPVWYAPNELWNAVVGNKYHFLCPNCFIKLASHRGRDQAIWSLQTSNPTKLEREEQR